MKFDLVCAECGAKVLTVDADDERSIHKVTGLCVECKILNEYSKARRKVDELVKVDPKQKRLA